MCRHRGGELTKNARNACYINRKTLLDGKIYALGKEKKCKYNIKPCGYLMVEIAFLCAYTYLRSLWRNTYYNVMTYELSIRENVSYAIRKYNIRLEYYSI